MRRNLWTPPLSTGLTNYIPGSFFLAANNGDYTAKVAYVRFTYRF